MCRIIVFIVSILIIALFFGANCHERTEESGDGTQNVCKADESGEMDICKDQGKL